MIPTHLKVLTIVERPFIYIRNKTFGVSCEEEREAEGWVECPELVDSSSGGGASFTTGGGGLKKRGPLNFEIDGKSI